MSVKLWQFFFEDDVDSFRQYLASATYSAAPQRGPPSGPVGTAAFKIGSPGNLATSPRTPVKSRKSLGYNQPASGTPQSKAPSVLLTRSDVNARDGFGRTLLHHIASANTENALDFASALLEIPFLDLYVQDAESGWTALHRALYSGNVSIAQALMSRDIKDATDYTTAVSHTHAGGLIKIKDHEGNSPFEVFGLTIASRLLEAGGSHMSLDADDGSNASVDLDHDGDNDEALQKRIAKTLCNVDGDEAFAFGSNKNLTLGLGDEDDRQYPERLVFRRPEHLLQRLLDDREVKRQKALPAEELSGSRIELPRTGQIPAVVQNQFISIQDVVMSKLHTAVLTNDPISNLYLCGFGAGGRLGTGDEATRFSYVCLQTGGLATRRVVAVALGQDHSIAVSVSGEVFSWGSNRYGQLGYTLPEGAANEIPTQLVPKQLYGHIKRESIIGAAASSIHSAIFTSTALYTFGKNEGQLGLMDADAGSLEMQIIPRRIGVSILQSPIKSVSAIDRATCVLMENHEVIVFTHYGFKKVENFPLYAFKNYALNKVDGNAICKITAGGNTLCALSTFGEVFTVDIPRCESPAASGSTTNPNKARNALGIPSRVWSIKKGHMSAIDAAVGQDGSIILCTEAGSVWRKEKRAKIKSVNHRDANSSRTKDYKFVRVSNLTRAVAVRSNAFGAFIAMQRDSHVTREQIIVDPPTLWDNMFSLLAFKHYKIEDGTDSAESRPRFWTPAVKDFSPSQIKNAILHSRDAEEDLQKMMAKFEPLADSPYDLWITSNVTDVRIPVHAFLIKSRSSVLRQALTEFQESYYYSIPDILSIEYGADGQVQMKFAGADFLTIFNLVFWLYTDNIVDVWHHIGRAVHMAPRYRQVRTELMRFATHLDLRHLERAVRFMTEPVKALRMDMEIAIRDADLFSDHDLLIELANGGEVPAHSALLCVRCPFFDGLFRGRAGGRWMTTRKDEANESAEALKVNLSHIDIKIFEIVLRHLYADTSEDLFDDVVTDGFESFLDLVIEVMSVANELMIERLAQVCQTILGRYATTRNICSLLNTASECSVEEFKHVGLEYICLNLEAMLTHHLLEELDPDLIYELDETVQSNQLAFMPFARSSLANNDLLERYPDLPAQIEQAKMRRVDSMRLRTRFNNDDEDRPISSNKLRSGGANLTSSSPSSFQNVKASAQHTQSPAVSPSLRARDAEQDLPFEMDEDSAPSKPSPWNAVPSPSIRPRDKSYPTSPSLESNEWLDSRGKPISGSIGTDSSSMPQSLPQPGKQTYTQPRGTVPAAHSRVEGFDLPSPKWNTPISSFKTDLRDIMHQASASQTSNLTEAMKQKEPEGPRAAKVSQKERKRRQQQEQGQLRAKDKSPDPPRPFPIATLPVAESPWKKVEKLPKPSLKDVMVESTPPPPSLAAKPVTKNTMTMRQTVSGTSPVPLKQVRSVSTTNAITPSSKPAPQIHSVRHIPSPTSSSAVDPTKSMAEILAQQDLEKRAVKEAAAKRSLQEIQQEQEFQEWWDNEAKRVQDEEQAARTAATSRDRGKGGRGRGGRGKGRGRGGAMAGESAGGGRSGKKSTTTS